MSSEIIPEIADINRPYDPADVLLYYDGPLLMWSPIPNRHLLALALMDDGVGVWPFLVVEVFQESADALMGNRLTRLPAVQSAQSKYLLRDFRAEG
jgi:hypothetical protein